MMQLILYWLTMTLLHVWAILCAIFSCKSISEGEFWICVWNVCTFMCYLFCTAVHIRTSSSMTMATHLRSWDSSSTCRLETFWIHTRVKLWLHKPCQDNCTKHWYAIGLISARISTDCLGKNCFQFCWGEVNVVTDGIMHIIYTVFVFEVAIIGTFLCRHFVSCINSFVHCCHSQIFFTTL